jgi:hypothetical protein
MRATLLCTAVVASLALPAQASEGIDLTMRPKSMAASTELPAKNAVAPFKHARDPMPELMLRDVEERRGPSGACENGATSLCYDMSSGKIVYRGAREYMPRIDGLQPESVSLRRGRLTLKYSF